MANLFRRQPTGRLTAASLYKRNRYDAAQAITDDFFEAPSGAGVTVSVATPLFLVQSFAPTTGRVMGRADPTSLTATASAATSGLKVNSTADTFVLSAAAVSATAKTIGGAAPYGLAVSALGATGYTRSSATTFSAASIAAGAMSVTTGSAVSVSYSVSLSSASTRVLSVAQPTTLVATGAGAGGRISGFAASVDCTLTFSNAAGLVAYISHAVPAELNVAAFDASDIISIAEPAQVYVSAAALFALGATFNGARIRMEFDMITAQDLTPAQIDAIAAAVVAQTPTPAESADAVWAHPFVSKLLTVAKYIGLK